MVLTSQDMADGTVYQQVRVAPDRRSEMGIGGVVQAEMPLVVRLVDRLTQRPQHHGLDDLADDTVRIDDGLAIVDFILATDVDEYAVPKRVGVDGHNFGDPNFVADLRPGGQEITVEVRGGDGFGVEIDAVYLDKR